MKNGILSLLVLLASSSVIAATTSTTNTATANTEPGLKSNQCEITCYQKTPSCYVSKDKDDCLVISSEPPKQTKDGYICKLKSCEIKTTYDQSGAKVETNSK